MPLLPRSFASLQPMGMACQPTVAAAAGAAATAATRVQPEAEVPPRHFAAAIHLVIHNPLNLLMHG